MRDVIIILGILGGIIWGLFQAGLFYLAWLVIGFGVLLAIMEIIARARTGRTISQRMWAYRGQHPVLGWVVLGVIGMALILLMIHLGWKTI